MKPEEIKEWQTRLGLTNIQAAKLLNNTPLRTYENWRRGIYTPPHCLKLAMELVASLEGKK